MKESWDTDENIATVLAVQRCSTPSSRHDISHHVAESRSLRRACGSGSLEIEDGEREEQTCFGCCGLRGRYPFHQHGLNLKASVTLPAPCFVFVSTSHGLTKDSDSSNRILSRNTRLSEDFGAGQSGSSKAILRWAVTMLVVSVSRSNHYLTAPPQTWGFAAPRSSPRRRIPRRIAGRAIASGSM
jgi:hypothetical protein